MTNAYVILKHDPDQLTVAGVCASLDDVQAWLTNAAPAAATIWPPLHMVAHGSYMHVKYTNQHGDHDDTYEIVYKPVYRA